MDVALCRVCCLLSVLLTATSVSPAADPPAEKPAAEYADPKATYRSYIEAVRKNDVKATKQCWVIDDDNKSGLRVRRIDPLPQGEGELED
jgi:hypothetical protein